MEYFGTTMWTLDIIFFVFLFVLVKTKMEVVRSNLIIWMKIEGPSYDLGPFVSRLRFRKNLSAQVTFVLFFRDIPNQFENDKSFSYKIEL